MAALSDGREIAVFKLPWVQPRVTDSEEDAVVYRGLWVLCLPAMISLTEALETSQKKVLFLFSSSQWILECALQFWS